MRHIPNILSIIRILILPLFVLSIYQESYTQAGLIIIFSGLTDLLDGFLARTFSWQSRLGELLDPLADKLTQTTIAFTFIIFVKEFRFFFWILLGKDILMLLGSFVSYRKKIHIPAAKWFGKVATALFYISMTLILLFPNLNDTTKNILLFLVAGSSVFAALKYLSIFFKKYETSKV